VGFSNLSAASRRPQFASYPVVRLIDQVGAGEGCNGIPLGSGGWVLTNLHCIEKSLSKLGLITLELMHSGVTYKAFASWIFESSAAGLGQNNVNFVWLPQVSLPEVPDVNGAVEFWAAGAGYPVLDEVESLSRSSFLSQSAEQEEKWIRDGAEFPLEDFALLRVPGLQQEKTCLLQQDFESAPAVSEDQILVMELGTRSYRALARLNPPELIPTSSPQPDRTFFWRYAIQSGLFLSGMPTEPGNSGLPILDASMRPVAMHSFGVASPAVSAEIPLRYIGGRLRARYPKIIGERNQPGGSQCW
jgi:hypothetical protein